MSDSMAPAFRASPEPYFAFGAGMRSGFRSPSDRVLNHATSRIEESCE